MSYRTYNPNPDGKNVGDCVIRGLCRITGQDWETVYLQVAISGFALHDMPSSNAVWGEYLKRQGFSCSAIPNNCPHCYTVRDFCRDNPQGTFLLATGTHVVAVVDGDYYDAWDSGEEVPVYYWREGQT